MSTKSPLEGHSMWINGHISLHDASFHHWEVDSAALKIFVGQHSVGQDGHLITSSSLHLVVMRRLGTEKACLL